MNSQKTAVLRINSNSDSQRDFPNKKIRKPPSFLHNVDVPLSHGWEGKFTVFFILLSKALSVPNSEKHWGENSTPTEPHRPSLRIHIFSSLSRVVASAGESESFSLQLFFFLIPSCFRRREFPFPSCRVLVLSSVPFPFHCLQLHSPHPTKSMHFSVIFPSSYARRSARFPFHSHRGLDDSMMRELFFSAKHLIKIFLHSLGGKPYTRVAPASSLTHRRTRRDV